MPHPIRLISVLVLALFVAAAYSPATFADKKDNNSSNSDDKKDKKDKKDNDDNHRGRDRRNSDDKKVGSGQIIQKAQQANSDKQNQNNSDNKKSSSDKQGNSNKTPPIIINGQKNGGQSNGQNQKPNQFPFDPKQKFPNNNPPNAKLPPNFPKQGDKDKKDNDKGNDKWKYQVDKKDKWQYQKHNDHKELNKWVDNFGGPKPFSSKWYKDHPKAWHHDHHDHNDAWKVATFAGIGGFLGWQSYHHHNSVYVYDPVPYDTLFVSRPGVIIDPNRGDWMPLGVYALMVSPGDENTRMLDLVVDRFGHIRGSYYDMISGATYNVAGIIDGQSQYAQWSLESNRDLTFFTPVGEMTQPQGYVEVRLPSGQRQQWQLVRMEPN